MKKTITLQNTYCSNYDYGKLCNVTVEVIDSPTTPLIHQTSRFWLIMNGRGIVKLQDREYELKPGTLVSVLPWQISDIIQVTEPLQYYLLAYYFDNINTVIKSIYNLNHSSINLIEEMGKNPVLYCNKIELASLQTLFNQLIDKTREETITEEISSLRYLYIINKLVEIFISFLLLSKQSPSSEPKSGFTIHKSDIFPYMYNNLSKKLTLAQLSAIFFMSESSISNYIMQTTGLSFFDLLNEMCTSKTINFLLNTDLTIDELAEILGFVDDSHINKVFSSRVGLNPYEFRKTYRRLNKLCGIPSNHRDYDIVSYIYRNYSDDLTPRETADKFHLSIKEMNTILLYQVEKNFSDFLHFIRINRASALLKSSDKSITDISMEIGYNNIKTFTRNFLKYRNMTPKDFRKNIELQKSTL